VGIEVLGVDDPYLDVEVIALAWRFFERLGLSRVRLVLNSLGAAGDRGRYTDALRDYFGRHLAALSPNPARRSTRNPLRVLDSKRDGDREIVAGAPRLRDYLSSDAAADFETVQEGCGASRSRSPSTNIGARARLLPQDDVRVRRRRTRRRAKRGRWRRPLRRSRRRDGWPSDAGIGFALGVDRTLLACDAEGAFPAPAAGRRRIRRRHRPGEGTRRCSPTNSGAPASGPTAPTRTVR
jgi:histidyl-tRNA synthetase